MARRRTEHDQAERPGQDHAERTAIPNAANGWIETQSRVFGQAGEIARRWLDRREEALDATRQSVDELRRSSDILDLVRIQQRWVLGEVQRMMADFAELSGAVLSLSKAAASRAQQEGEVIPHGFERAGREALEMAGDRPHARRVDE